MSTKNKSQKTSVGCTRTAGNENQKNQDFKLSQSCFEQKISEDGLSYLDIHYKSNQPIRKVVFSCGKDGVTEAWLQFIKKEDDAMVSNEIDQSRLRSWEFDSADSTGDGDRFIENHSVQKQKTVHELAFPEERVLSKEEKLVQEVLATCTEKQLFVYELRCCRTYPMSYPDIAELYTEYFGTPTSEDGVRNLYLKVCDKVCRALGVKRPRKNKHS